MKNPSPKSGTKKNELELESLRQDHARLLMAIESTKIGLWEFYPKTGEMIWSPECRIMYGLDEAITASPEAFKKIIHPDDWDMVAKEIGKPIPNSEVGNYELQFRIIRNNDQSIRTIKAKWKVYFDLTQVPESYIGIVIDITEERKREQQIEEMQSAFERAEDQRQLLFQSLPFAMYATDAEGKVTHYNSAAVELWGREPVIGTDYWSGSSKLYTPEGKMMPLDISPMAIALKEKREVKGAEIVIERPDGTRRFVLPHPYPILDVEGNLLGGVNTIVDITDRRVVEIAVRESEANLRALFDNTNDGFVLLDTSSNILAFNHAASALYKKMFGKTLETGKEVTTILGERLGGYVLQAFEKVLIGESVERKSQQRATDGKEYWLRGYYNPVKSSDGKIIGICMGIADITTEMEAEAKISVLAAIVKDSDDAIYSTDLQGTVISWNHGAEKIFGRSAEEIIGKSATSIHTEVESGEEQTILSRIQNGESFNLDTYRLKKDGEKIFTSLTVSPIRNSDGIITGVSRILRDITEPTRIRRETQKELEKQVVKRTIELTEKNALLRRQRDFVETVLDSSVDQICVYDNEKRFIAANKKFSEMSGIRVQDILGKTFIEVFPSLKNSVMHNGLNSAINGNLTENIVWESPGTGHLYSISCIPLIQNDEVYGAIVAAHDNTNILRTTEQLQQFNRELEEKNLMLAESEERYQKMVEEVQDYAIIILDKDGIIQNWNIGVEKIKGYTAEEIIGQHFRIFYPDEDQQKRIPEHNLEQATLTGRVETEGWRIRKGGFRFWGSTILTALHGDNDEIIGFVKLTKDHTARKNAEDKIRLTASELQERNEELQQQKVFIERVFDASIDLITVYDIDTRVISINKRVEELLGVKREELIGKKYLEVFPETKSLVTYNHLLRAISGEPTHHVLPRGEMGHTFDIFMIPLKHNEEVNAVLVLTHDISDIMNISEELSITNAVLEDKNSQLLQSNKELEQFTYIASHDLQEPLRKIRLFTGRIQESQEGFGDQTRTYLSKIALSAERMSELIKDVLQFSRLTNLDSQFEPTDLNEILKSVLSDFDLSIEEKKAVITSNALPLIDGIPQQFNQLFYNLISNSLKFSHKGIPPQITIGSEVLELREVRSKKLDEANVYYKITFKDNGIGFEQQFAERIFTIFQRLNDRTKFEGTGIGLALCRKIVTVHNGEIYAQSKEGEGSEFTIILPEKQYRGKDTKK